MKKPNAMNSDSAFATAACMSACSPLGCDKPEKHPGISKWPKYVTERCRTVKHLTSGPYKGKEAKIVRSLWSMCGVDSIYTTKVNYLLGSGLIPLWKFYIELPLICPEAESSLYYGKIDGDSYIISETWLSDDDIKNLFNFHRYELLALAPQLFQKHVSQESHVPQLAPCQELLLQKIRNETDVKREKSTFIKAALNEAIKHGNDDIISRIIKITNSFPWTIQIPFRATIEYAEKGDKLIVREKDWEKQAKTKQEQAKACRAETFTLSIKDAVPLFQRFPTDVNRLIAGYLFC